MKSQVSSARIILISLTAGALLASCGGGASSVGDGSLGVGRPRDWLIPSFDIADGGPGQDGIPALQNPKFEPAATINTVDPQDLVIVLREGATVKAYPHDIMDYHEIVNDGPANDPFTMSYCPLTGSALAWKGRATDADPTFGVSGLLYNSNLLLYDRQSESIWSQLLELAVFGPRQGDRPENIRLFETTFATLQSMYPDAIVLSRDTGHVRGYDDYPYGNYKTDPQLIFPASRYDNRMHAKERFIGIHENTRSRVYQLEAFSASTQTINDQFNDQSIVVVGNSALSFAAIYSRVLSDGTILNFSPINNDLPNVMSDDEGNVWDILGMAVSGPRAGTQLATTRSYVAMWFAWVSHFEEVEIHL
jgi:hypothetical protein